MKQKFDKNNHKKFKEYFDIKEFPGNIELSFYKKTEKYIKYIKWIPGLKMIGIGNSIAMNSASADSDIDLLIVTTPNSMWFNRIMITFIFQILGVRKNEKYHAGRFCLSFFCTTSGLDFSLWKIDNDIYLYFWIIYFKPILNYNNTYESFIEKNSSWADFSEYNYMFDKNKGYVKFQKNTSNLEGYLLKFINNLFKKLFLPKTLKHFEKIGRPYGVIINDNLLKFHNGDIRIQITKELV